MAFHFPQLLEGYLLMSKTHREMANEILANAYPPGSGEPVKAAPSQIVRVIEEVGLTATAGDALRAALEPLFLEGGRLMDESRNIVVTDATDVSGMKGAGKARKAIKEVCIQYGKRCDDAKENAIAMQRGVVKVKNFGLEIMLAEESRLAEQETFAERVEAKRRAETKARRATALSPYTEDVDIFPLEEMSEPQFLGLLQQYINLKAANEEKSRQEEQALLAAEQKRLEEEARIRVENVRLQKEADEQRKAADDERIQREHERMVAETKAAKAREAADEAARIEKLRVDAVLAQERRQAAEAARVAEEKARLERVAAANKAADERRVVEAAAQKERELRAAAEKKLADQKAAEAKAKADAEKARKKAEAAPDRHKLGVLAQNLRELYLPEVKDPDAKSLVEKIRRELDGSAVEIEDFLIE